MCIDFLNSLRLHHYGYGAPTQVVGFARGSVCERGKDMTLNNTFSPLVPEVSIGGAAAISS